MGYLEDDGEGGQEEGKLLGTEEDAVLPLDQPVPGLKDDVGGAEDEAEPADVCDAIMGHSSTLQTTCQGPGIEIEVLACKIIQFRQCRPWKKPEVWT